MTTYQEAQSRLAARTEAAVLAAYEALPPASFVVGAATAVGKANVVAVGLADLSFAAVAAVLPIGLGRPDDDHDRLARSFTTLVRRIAEEVAGADLARPLAAQIPSERAEPVRARVSRLAVSEPRHAGRVAYQQAMQAHPELVVGWRRQTSANPCGLCASLAGGKVLDPQVPIVDHPHCACVAVPVLRRAA